jgi:hypothetical protein
MSPQELSRLICRLIGAVIWICIIASLYKTGRPDDLPIYPGWSPFVAFGYMVTTVCATVFISA